MSRTFRRTAWAGVIFSSIVALLFVAAPVSAADVPTSAIIVSPLSIDLVEDPDGLEFGEIVSDSDGGTVTINQDGTQGANGVTTVTDGNPAYVIVTGTPTSDFDINVDASVTLTGPGEDMEVTLDAPDSGLLDGSGFADFNIGGTLTVNPNQATGTYSSSFNVTVSYN